MNRLGFMDPVTALTVGTGLFSIGAGVFGKDKAADMQAQLIKDQKAAAIRQATIQRQTLAAEQNRQAKQLLLNMSRERRGEQTALLTAIGVGAAVISGILIFKALNKKKPSTALARRR
jgi:hypothetical protein